MSDNELHSKAIIAVKILIALALAGLLVAYAIKIKEAQTNLERPFQGEEVNGERPIPDLTAAYVARSIDALCTQDFSGNDALYASCRRKSIEGVKAFRDVALRLGASASPHLFECYDVATSYIGTDFIIAGQCAGKIGTEGSDTNASRGQ